MADDGRSAGPVRAAREWARGWARGWAAVAAAAALAACGEDEAPRLHGQGAPPPATAGASAAPAADAPADTAPRVRAVTAVQVGAFRDSGGAARLRDSLAGQGWQAYLRRVVGPDTVPPWRVRVSPSRERALAEVVAAGFREAGRTVLLVADSALMDPRSVQLHRVNDGTFGMIARARWVLSPDRRGMIVVEDATAIEGDPLPDGFLYAGERGPMVMQRDSVWDVAPNPAWTRVVYGKAYLIREDGRNASSIRPWFNVATRSGMEVAAVRQSAFPASGMSQLMGFAHPMLEPLHPDSVEESLLRRQVTVTVPVAGGWRVRWARDGNTIAVGLPPVGRVSDDAPASSWLELDPRSHLVRGALQDYLPLATVPWVEGPVMDVSVPLDTRPRRLEVAGGVVEGRDGWISLRADATGGRTRVLGPGIPLAATASGRFVAAIVPVLARREHDPTRRVAVYELLP